MQLVKRFAELGIKDVPLVGGKNASLGEMYRELKDEGVEVPNGFATTADAYRLYIEHNNLHERIAKELGALDTTDVRALAISGARIRQWIMHGAMPQQLVDEIREAYKELEAEVGDNIDVAVRSSATAEDLPNASFAGQQETYLNIRGTNNLLATCKQVFSSLFTDRAISYRVHQGFDHMDVALSIGVQQMVRADIGASGVMFSIDTETGFRDVVFITAAYGLGETVVQGSVNPDEFYVFKPTLSQGKRPILKRQLGEKAIKMIYTSDPMAGMSTRTVNVGRAEQRKFAITDEEVLQLARYAAIIEKHYDRPMDIEWAKDGNTGRLYILQARPETVQAGLDATMHEVFRLKSRGEVLATGKSVGQRIATGKARVILEASQMHELQPGEVLITDMTDPDWEPVMKVASAIVTNRGGRTCHAAIIARELGIPAVVGTGNTTQTVSTGQTVTVSCAEGDTGLVYEGEQEFEVEKVDLSRLKKPNTKIML
ncbi:MAG: phosphoenolpyruvate synthase, partial [Pseudomonadota bacterium]